MNRLFNKINCAYHNIIEAICRRMDIALINSNCFKGKTVFGPVVSRRLGYSLGINGMKCKMCTYDCIYCQIGQTPCRSTCRESCIGEYELYCVVRKKLELLKQQNIPVDYITFIPTGEPTLDDNLSQKIRLLREFGLKIAVITNGSLLWNNKVQEDLLFADYISVKIDTINEETWLLLNRPHSRLKFHLILEGINKFAKRFQGELTTETMTVKNINDTIPELEGIIAYLKSLKRVKSYFMVPTRPPVASYAIIPDKEKLLEILNYLKQNLQDVETYFTLTDEEFYGAGELENELLATLSVHPMQEKAIKNFIARKDGDPATLEKLLKDEKINRVFYNGTSFFHAAITEQP